MNYILNAPFILDFFATTGLFIMCFLVVIGSKVAISSLKQLFPKQQNSIPKESQNKPAKPYKKTKKCTTDTPIRSIEIDPDKIDRIYVKKIS